MINACSSNQVFKHLSQQFELESKRVLEVGGILDESLIKNYNLEWISVDPLYTPLSGYDLVSPIGGKKVVHLKRDIAEVNFPTEYFDVIFSCNAFQHIRKLDNAFDKFYGWLKPGGILYAHFGPIWTAPDGCHIEGLKYGQKVYNFWEDKLIPFWAHLYFDPSSMFTFLHQYYPPSFCELIVHSIYESTWINRMKYSDYRRLINMKPWHVFQFSPSNNIDYVPFVHYSSLSPGWERRILSELQRTPGEDFNVRDLLLILGK